MIELGFAGHTYPVKSFFSQISLGFGSPAGLTFPGSHRGPASVFAPSILSLVMQEKKINPVLQVAQRKSHAQQGNPALRTSLKVTPRSPREQHYSRRSHVQPPASEGLVGS